MPRSPKSSISGLVQRNIKAFRLEAGLTQQQLATKAGLHVRYISRLEISPQNITLEILESIAEALGKKPSELLGGIYLTKAKGDMEVLDEAIKNLQVIRARFG